MYSVGENLLELVPFVTVLDRTVSTVRCSSCFKRLESGNGSVCVRCSSVRYCSRTCQDNHTIHRKECRCLRRASESNKFPDRVIRLVALAMWKLKDKSSAKTSYTIGDKTYCYQDLPSHRVYQLTESPNPDAEVFLRGRYNQLQTFIDGGSISFEDFCTLYGKVVKHTLQITENLSESIGLGMYFGMAALQHSCRPNANVSYSGTTARIIAACDFEDADSKTITIRLVSTMATREARQTLLRSYTGENCNCEICESEEFENSLNEVVSGEEALAVMSSAMKTLDDLEENACKYGKEEIKKAACDALTKINGVAGDFNHIRGRILRIAARSCWDLERHEEAIMHYEQLLNIYRYVFGPNSVEVMQVLKKLAESSKATGNLVTARDYFSEHLQVVHNIYGFQHPFFQKTRYDFIRMEQSNWDQD